MADQETIGTAGATHSLPRVRAITPRDLVDVLAKGFDDFWAMPTHVIFLSLIYPIAGIIIAGVTLGYDLLPLFYPMASWIWALVALQLLFGMSESMGWLGAQTMIGQYMHGKTHYAGRLSFIIRIGQLGATEKSDIDVRSEGVDIGECRITYTRGRMTIMQ